MPNKSREYAVIGDVRIRIAETCRTCTHCHGYNETDFSFYCDSSHAEIVDDLCNAKEQCKQYEPQ